MSISLSNPEAVREEVREHYANRVREQASSCGCGCGCSANGDGVAFYGDDDLALVPAESASVSYGCGNPTAIAELKAGEFVLDLGSGGGIDVFLSAERVGPTGYVYGVDMTDEMLELARRNAQRQGRTNVEFRKGYLEELPLADATVDVIISNCVVNLSPDKRQTVAEAFRVLRAGGRLAISDVVIEGDLSDVPMSEAQIRAALSWAGCVAGALPVADLERLLIEAGFEDVSIEVQHRYRLEELADADRPQLPGIPAEIAAQLVHRFTSAMIRATKP